MDKHLHKDIGEQFSNEINKLSRQPRGHIWENIDKQLDKTDVANYKEKCIRLRKRTLLLLLLLVGFSTFSVIYFSNSENKNKHEYAAGNSGLTTQKINEQISSLKKENIITVENNAPSTNNIIQQSGNTIATESLPHNSNANLYATNKTSVKQKGETKAKITKAATTENETQADDATAITDTDIPNEKVAENIPELINKAAAMEKKPAEILSILKKDSLATVSKNNNKKQTNKHAKFTLTAFAAPDYAKYRLVNDKQNNYDTKADIATREHSDLSASMGILLGYKIGNKVTIQSGIIYSSANISINPTKIYAEKNYSGAVKFRYNTSSGYGYLLPSFSGSPAVGDSLIADGANHTIRYFSIPVIVKYKLGNNKLTFNPGIGITFNFLSKATLTTDLVDQLNRETEYISKLEGLNKFSMGLIITPEMQYQLSKKFSLSIMPYFKYAVSPINKGNVVKTYPYTYGLGAGAVYKF